MVVIGVGLLTCPRCQKNFSLSSFIRVRLEDGPATGQRLDVIRAPLLLRVVCSGRGRWDAIDNLDAAPKSGHEIVLAYMRRSEPEIKNYSWEGGNEKVYSQSVSYFYVEDQPSEEVMRENDTWRAWARGVSKSTQS
jgi:hypothetical protein